MGPGVPPVATGSGVRKAAFGGGALVSGVVAEAFGHGAVVFGGGAAVFGGGASAFGVVPGKGGAVFGPRYSSVTYPGTKAFVGIFGCVIGAVLLLGTPGRGPTG